MPITSRDRAAFTVVASLLTACGPALAQCPGISTVSDWYASPARPVDGEMWSQCAVLMADCATSSVDSSQAHARADFCAAMALRANGDEEGALELLSRAATADPEWAAPPAVMGAMSLEAGDGQAALAHLEKAVVMDPLWTMPLNDLGLALQATGDLQGALERFDAVIVQDPLMAAAHANRAGLLAAMGELDEAMKSYLIAIELEPEEPVHCYNLAGVLEALGEYELAAASYARMMQLMPAASTAALHLKRGWALQAAGLDEEAEECYLEAIALCPTSVAAISSLASLYVEMEKTSEAIEAYSDLGELDPEGAAADLYTLAVLWVQDGRTSYAMQALGTVVALQPTWAQPRSLLGTLMLHAGALQQAADLLTSALETAPDDHAILQNLGIAHARMYDHAEAEKHLRASIEHEPGIAATHSWLGEALRMAGRLEESLAEHDEAVTLRPDLARMHARRARTLLEMGRRKEADAALDEAERLDPDDPETLLARGLSLLGSKKTRDEAIENLTLAILGDPMYAEAHAALALALSKSKKTMKGAAESLATALELNEHLTRLEWVAKLVDKLAK